MTTLSKSKVVLGLSGGVDSTTAALLLKEKGFQVVGYYFDALGTNTEGVQTASKLAETLGIEFIHSDVSKEFDITVIGNFCDEYINGRTPNPCIVCNPTIKFKKLLEIADEVGAYYIATGHYARIFHNEQNGRYWIKRGTSEKKDQSYMLYRLGEEVISRLVLPLGDFADKEKTRTFARDNHLPNAEASDSQEICFIDEEKDDYVSSIEKRGFPCAKGNFIDKNGNILGQHQGLIHYTIGQRKGLGITLGKPVFVTAIDPEKNTVTLGNNEDLFTRNVYTKDYIFPEINEEPIRVTAKIRYAAKPASAVVTRLGDGRLLATFDEPQRAVTSGQSIVFYDDDILIGGGFITK